MSYVFQIIASQVGRLKLIASPKGLAGILWESDKDARTPHLLDAQEDKTNPILLKTAQQLAEYFAGARTKFDLPLDFHGNDFNKKVWNLLLAIPYGETRSYGQLAKQMGSPGAARAVGTANARNPISIVAPCHRVIGANGKLTGFAGGLKTKAYLLELESADLLRGTRKSQAVR